MKVATFKQSGRPLTLEYPLSDGVRLANAGTVRSVVFTPNGTMVTLGGKPDLEQSIEAAGEGCDVLLVEGRTLDSRPVVEIVRAGLPVFKDDEVWLSVSFKPTGRTREVRNEAEAAKELIRRIELERSEAALPITR